jgi:hypothetical protein
VLDVAVGHTEVAPDLLYKRALCSFEVQDFYAVAADTGRAIKVGKDSHPPGGHDGSIIPSQ